MIMIKGANSILCIWWNSNIVEYRITEWNPFIYIKIFGKIFGDQLKLSDIVKLRFQITAVANNIAVLTRQTKGNQWAYVALTEWKIILEVNVVET